MTIKDFTLLINEVLNEFGCRLIGLSYNEERICKVIYESDISEGYFYTPYRFMNRARLRLKIMDELYLLVPVNPELDFGF